MEIFCSFFFFVDHNGGMDIAQQQSKKELTVYWGQDSAGSLRLTLEKRIDHYCLNYDYDIIPIAFLNVFFDTANKGTHILWEREYNGISLNRTPSVQKVSVLLIQRCSLYKLL